MSSVGSPSNARRSDHSIIMVLLAVGSFLVLFGLRAAEQTGDGLDYAVSIRDGVETFHPHHLLYIPIVRAIMAVTGSFSEAGDAVLASQIHNTLWSVVAALAMYLLITGVFSSRLLGVLGALLLMFSRGFWTSAGQAGVYAPAVGCLVLMAAILTSRREHGLTLGRMIGISLAWAMAVFYHQTNVLIAIPLGYFLLTAEGHGRVKALILVPGLAAVVVILGYALAFFSTHPNASVAEFIRFPLSYTFFPNPTWGTFNNVSIVGIRSLFRSQLWSVGAFPGVLRPMLFGLIVVLVCLWNLIQSVRQAKHGRLRGLAVLWVGAYLSFFLWWLPTYKELFAVTLPAIFLLGFLTLRDLVSVLGSRGRRLEPVIVAVLVLAVLALNIRVFLPLHRSRGAAYREAVQLAGLAPENCAIFANWTVRNNLRYYFERPRVIEGNLAFAYFYQHFPLPSEYRLQENEFVLVSPPYIAPDHRVLQYDGYRNSAEWVELMGWLFNFEYDFDHRLVACREFEVVRGGEDAYLLLFPALIQVDGLGQLMEMLDGRLSGHPGARDSAFARWFSVANPDL